MSNDFKREVEKNLKDYSTDKGKRKKLDYRDEREKGRFNIIKSVFCCLFVFEKDADFHPEFNPTLKISVV